MFLDHGKHALPKKIVIPYIENPHLLTIICACIVLIVFILALITVCCYDSYKRRNRRSKLFDENYTLNKSTTKEDDSEPSKEIGDSLQRDTQPNFPTPCGHDDSVSGWGNTDIMDSPSKGELLEFNN